MVHEAGERNAGVYDAVGGYSGGAGMIGTSPLTTEVPKSRRAMRTAGIHRAGTTVLLNNKFVDFRMSNNYVLDGVFLFQGSIGF